MANDRIQELRQLVQQINSATTCAEFDALWLDLVGLESVDYEDEAGAQSVEEARAILLDYVREECFYSGIHSTDVGIFGVH